RQPPRVAMVFCGQGAQWRGMAQGLLRDEPVFRVTVERFATSVDRLVEWRLLDELTQCERSDDTLRQEVAQPATLALQLGILELWRSWGVTPAAVVGHSLGEIAAAYAANALTIDDAARIACARGRVVGELSGRGRMLHVALSAAEAEQLLTDMSWSVEVAAENSPQSTTLTGDVAAVLAAGRQLEALGIEHQLLVGDTAFH